MKLIGLIMKNLMFVNTYDHISRYIYCTLHRHAIIELESHIVVN